MMVYFRVFAFRTIEFQSWKDTLHEMQHNPPQLEIFLDIPQLNAKPSQLWIERQQAESKFA